MVVVASSASRGVWLLALALFFACVRGQRSRFAFATLQRPAKTRPACRDQAISLVRPCFEHSNSLRDRGASRRLPARLGQAKLRAVGGEVGERLKAILALLFDLAMSFDEPKLMRGGSR